MSLPAYGVLNVWKVAAGTGEALPGPMMLRSDRRSDPSYNRVFGIYMPSPKTQSGPTYATGSIVMHCGSHE
jgi:hypothetical protein